MRHSRACCPCSTRWTKHLAPAEPSGFCHRFCWQSPRCTKGRSSRILALILNSMSSSGEHSELSFVVSHSAFSSPPIWERRAAEFLRGSQRASPNTGNFQFPTRRAHHSRHRSVVHRWTHVFQFSCASLATASASSPKVSIACGPVDLATLGATGRCCAKNTIGRRRSVGVTSNPPAFLGKRTLLMEACSSLSCPTNVGNKESTISSSFLCVKKPGLQK